MPVYKYKAMALNGSAANGRKEAASEEQLATILRGEGRFLTSSSVVEAQKSTTKLKTEEVADFCRQLAAMLSSGITLIRAMMILVQRDQKPHVKKVYTEVIEDLQRGATLSEAMMQRGRAFPELLTNMIHAGENTGRLDVTCQKMAESYDKEHRLNAKIKSATTYPIILVFLVLIVVIVIFTFVLPKFISIFGEQTLPLPTRIVMAISNFLIEDGVIFFAGVFVAIALLVLLFRQPGPRKALDKFKLHIPKIGKLLQTIYTGRFARTLASLYVSGIPMIHALNIARKTVGNKYIESQFDQVIENLGNGRTLSQAIYDVDGFEPKLRSTVSIGEESGRLEQMLESVADQFDYDSEMASQRLVSFIEPVLIVVMAAIVGSVIISVMLPIFQMYGSIEQ